MVCGLPSLMHTPLCYTHRESAVGMQPATCTHNPHLSSPLTLLPSTTPSQHPQGPQGPMAGCPLSRAYTTVTPIALVWLRSGCIRSSCVCGAHHRSRHPCPLPQLRGCPHALPCMAPNTRSDREPTVVAKRADWHGTKWQWSTAALMAHRFITCTATPLVIDHTDTYTCMPVHLGRF